MQCWQFSFRHLQLKQTCTVCTMRYQGNPRTSSTLLRIFSWICYWRLGTWSRNTDFVLKVRVNYKGWLTALNIDRILVLCDPNMFSMRIRNRFFFWSEHHVLEWNTKYSQVVIFVKISRVYFHGVKTSALGKIPKTLPHSRNKCDIQQRQTIDYPLLKVVKYWILSVE